MSAPCEREDVLGRAEHSAGRRELRGAGTREVRLTAVFAAASGSGREAAGFKSWRVTSEVSRAKSAKAGRFSASLNVGWRRGGRGGLAASPMSPGARMRFKVRSMAPHTWPPPCRRALSAAIEEKALRGLGVLRARTGSLGETLRSCRFCCPADQPPLSAAHRIAPPPPQPQAGAA